MIRKNIEGTENPIVASESYHQQWISRVAFDGMLKKKYQYEYTASVFPKGSQTRITRIVSWRIAGVSHIYQRIACVEVQSFPAVHFSYSIYSSDSD